LHESVFLNTVYVAKRIVVLAGTGGNGGGAMVCARRLACWGGEVKVILTGASGNQAAVPGHQLDILKRMEVDVLGPGDLSVAGTPDLIIDGIIGYSLTGSPRRTAAEMIRWANSRSVPILSLDVPSGIDASTGKVFDPAVKAMATMTLALPKEGLRRQGSEELVGELYLADISVPPRLYLNMWRNLKIGDIFAESDVVRIA
jgi:NAD(P)H-hydrate epimerase